MRDDSVAFCASIEARLLIQDDTKINGPRERVDYPISRWKSINLETHRAPQAIITYLNPRKWRFYCGADDVSP